MYECITEYDREKVLAELREEAWKDGFIEGFTESFIKSFKESFKEAYTLEVALSMLKLGTMPKEDIAVVTGLTVERINQLAEQSNI